MFDLNDVFVAAIFVTFIMLWWNAQGVKQKALQATKDHCKRMGVQLLDDGVALRGFWFKRDRRGGLSLWRSYEFEFTSTGEQRYHGKVILLGRVVEEFQMDPYREN